MVDGSLLRYSLFLKTAFDLDRVLAVARLLAESSPTRSTVVVARVLHNGVRLRSVAAPDNLAIRSGDGEGEEGRTVHLTKEDAEGKVLSSLECVLCGIGALEASFYLNGGNSICVASIPAALSFLAKPQEDNVIGIGDGERVGARDLSKDLNLLSAF